MLSPQSALAGIAIRSCANSRRRAGPVLWMLTLVTLTSPCRADTVASLLGNFTINQFCGIALENESIHVHYAVVFGQLPALSELHSADRNGDGVTSQSEREAYVQAKAPEFASHLKVRVDGVAVPLHLARSASSLPTEQGGFSLRLDADFLAALPAQSAGGTHSLQFSNDNFDGRFGWQEITVQAVPPLKVFDSNGFSTSLTGGLTEALQSLPPQGALAERSVRLSFTQGVLPEGATPLGPRPAAIESSPMPATQSLGNGDNAWLQRETRVLINLISAPRVPLHITLLALLAAFVLGALHAFSPGHGKTIVAAYLIGSRGTPRHAAFLGVTVTITHTLGVFLLGFATLFAARYIVPERLFPILSLMSGLIVLGMGMILLAQRWRAALSALARQPHMHRGQGHSHAHAHAHTHPHSHAHAHAHDHEHDHAHDPGHDGALTHSHGGSTHSHLPPGTDGTPVTWRSLLALGISGGLVPCPSAMVLLLAAVALNKTAYGMLLVLGFSVGLAVTLTGVGLAFLYARNRIPRPGPSARWPVLLPVASAAAITLVGVLLCFGAIQSTRF